MTQRPGYYRKYDRDPARRKAASERAARARERNWEIINRFKLERGCSQCGYEEGWVTARKPTGQRPLLLDIPPEELDAED